MQRGDIYEAAKGVVVEALGEAPGEPSLDGSPLKHLTANTTDGATEKHVPVIEKVAGGYKVKIGSVPHPMEEKHYIVWIELSAGPKVYKHYLKPGDAPEAVFLLDDTDTPVSAREYCNIHGLWKS